MLDRIALHQTRLKTPGISLDPKGVALGAKGLSAPVGSLLAGNRSFIEKARKVRRAFGGAMRQAGIIAAPGLVALRTMIDRLAEDHENARMLAHSLALVPGLAIDLESVQTDIVNVDVAGLGIDAATFARYLDACGVRGLPGMGTMLRFVTYRGITRSDVERAATTIHGLVSEQPWKGEALTPSISGLTAGKAI